MHYFSNWSSLMISISSNPTKVLKHSNFKSKFSKLSDKVKKLMTNYSSCSYFCVDLTGWAVFFYSATEQTIIYCTSVVFLCWYGNTAHKLQLSTTTSHCLRAMCRYNIGDADLKSLDYSAQQNRITPKKNKINYKRR